MLVTGSSPKQMGSWHPGRLGLCVFILGKVVNLALLLKTSILAKFIDRECKGSSYNTKGFAACRLARIFKREFSYTLGALQSSDNSKIFMKTNYSLLSLCLKFKHDLFWIVFSSSKVLSNWRRNIYLLLSVPYSNGEHSKLLMAFAQWEGLGGVRQRVNFFIDYLRY